MNKILIGGILILVGFGISLASKLLNDQQEKKNDLSAFDLNLFIHVATPTNFEKLWISELNKYGLNCEIDPRFNFKNQEGFLPFKLQIDTNNKHIQTSIYPSDILHSGFELNISPFNSKDYFSYWEKEDLESLDTTFKTKVESSNYEFVFSANPTQNITELRFTWYAAASLLKIYHGVLMDNKTGENYYGNDAIELSLIHI